MLIGMFIRPRRTLQAVAEHNGRGWWLPALIVLVLTVVVAAASGPITARQMREQLVQMQSTPGQPGGQADPEQVNQMLDYATSPIFTTVLPAAFDAVKLTIGWVAQVGLLYLITIVLGGRTRFGAMWGTALWAGLPFAVRSLLQTVYILLTNQVIRNPGLSGLVEIPSGGAWVKLSAGQRMLITILGRIDLFAIWNLVLLAIGLAAAARFSGRKAALIVLSFWVLSTALAIAFDLAQASLAGGI